MSERVYIIPYVPRAEYPISFPYEYDDEDYFDEEEEQVLKANIKELQREIEKMGKKEYLRQRKVNRKGATAAYNEAFRQVKYSFTNMKKHADSGATKGFKRRVFKRLRERPGNVGFEILARKERINLIELVDGSIVPTEVSGIAKHARERVKFKIKRKRITGTKNLFIAKRRDRKGPGVYYKKKGRPYPISATTDSHAARLERPAIHRRVSEITLNKMLDMHKKTLDL